jgi:hypothetical protein
MGRTLEIPTCQKAHLRTQLAAAKAQRGDVSWADMDRAWNYPKGKLAGIMRGDAKVPLWLAQQLAAHMELPLAEALGPEEAPPLLSVDAMPLERCTEEFLTRFRVIEEALEMASLHLAACHARPSLDTLHVHWNHITHEDRLRFLHQVLGRLSLAPVEKRALIYHIEEASYAS